MCSYDRLEDSGLPAGVAAGMVDSRERKGEELEKLEREFLGMVPGGGIMKGIKNIVRGEEDGPETDG